jgi:hypothetical protein
MDLSITTRDKLKNIIITNQLGNLSELCVFISNFTNAKANPTIGRINHYTASMVVGVPEIYNNRYNFTVHKDFQIIFSTRKINEQTMSKEKSDLRTVIRELLQEMMQEEATSDGTSSGVQQSTQQ